MSHPLLRSAPILTLAGLAIALDCGCGGTTTQAGLEVVLSTNLSYPAQFDSLTFEIDQLGANDASHVEFQDVGFEPGNPTLPTTYAIATGTSANETARVTFQATLQGSVVARREIIVQLPTDRVATLPMALDGDCYRVLCGGGESCDPKSGACASDSVNEKTLATYAPGAGVPDASPSDASDATVNDAHSREAGSRDAMARGDAPDGGSSDGGIAEASFTERCEGGPCAATRVAFTNGRPTALAVDGTNVYWAVAGEGTIWSRRIVGGIGAASVYTDAAGPITTLVGNPGLTDGGQGIFWSYASHDAAAFGGCIGNPCTEAPPSLPSDQPPVQSIVGFPLTYELAWTSGREVQQCALNACADADVVSREEAGAPTSVTSDGTNIYWLNPAAGLVESAPIVPNDGGPRTLRLTGGMHAGPLGTIAIGQSDVYWTEPDAGLVRMVPNGGGDAATFAKAARPLGVVIEDEPGAPVVYWTDWAAGEIRSCADGEPGACVPAVVASGLHHPRLIVLDPVNIYWTEDDDGDGGLGTGQVKFLSRTATGM